MDPNKGYALTDRMRAWLYGLGAFCLLAMGVHAAADCIDDRIAQGVEGIDAFIDGFFARFDLTRPLVDAIGTRGITRFGRAVAFLWELALDLLVGLSVFAFERRKDTRDSLAAIYKEIAKRTQQARSEGARVMAMLVRPVLGACFVLAGSAAVGRIVQGGVTLGLRGWFGGAAPALGQILGLCVLGACLVVLGVDAIAAAFSRASRKDEPILFVRTWKSELWVAGLGLPLAWFALFEATALGGFLR
ncbi:MAG: hypothetical protein IT381_00700 [Deltaproteobacteria bacterium]|nr:hypothetical protein [Deltaproteobacteria bacterium]